MTKKKDKTQTIFIADPCGGLLEVPVDGSIEETLATAFCSADYDPEEEFLVFTEEPHTYKPVQSSFKEEK